MNLAFLQTIVGVVALATVTGCGNSQAVVSGTVTVAGQPVANGQIEFSPKEGGTPVGAPIVAGKYSARMLSGEKTVLITETLELDHPTSTEELQRAAAQGKPLQTQQPKSAITAETKGNSQMVTLKTGEQTLNFTLEPAAR